MLRNYKQIRLERVANRLNSSAYGQTKDSKYKKSKTRFSTFSLSYTDDPLGQLTCLSSRDILFNEEFNLEIIHQKNSNQLNRIGWYDTKLRFQKKYFKSKKNANTRISELY